MSISLEEDFDGQVIGIVDGFIGPRHGGLAAYFFEKRGALRRVDPYFLTSAGLQDKTNTLPRRDQEILADGKILAAILENSDGGSAYWASQFRNAFEEMRERGGRVETYGFHDFHSAAAAIWAMGDKRFCAKESLFSMHVREGSPEDPAEMNTDVARRIDEEERKRRLQDREEIVEFIMSLKDEYAKSVLLKRAAQDPEGRATIVLNGDLLKALGGAEKVFSDHSETFRHFFNRTGWQPSRWKFLTDPVGIFVRSTLGWSEAVKLLA